MTELPTGWTDTTLGEIGEYLNGRGFKKSEWREAGRPIIRIQNLTGTSEQFNYFDGRAEERYMARPGDVLVSWAATLGVFVWKGPEAVINQHIFKVHSLIDNDFHRYLILSVLGDLRRQTHGSGMVHITKGRFEQTPVALPPLAEQRRIVAAIEEQFSRLDAGLMTLGRIRQNLKRMRTAVLQELLGYGYLEPLPNGWRWTKIAEVTGQQKSPVLTGPFGTTLGRADFVSDGVPVLTIGCLTPEGISIDKAPRVSIEKAASLSRYSLAQGDVLFSRMATVGRAAVVGDREAGSLINYHLMRLRVDESVLGSDYLAVLCRGSRAIRQYLTDSNHGVTRPGINTKQLINLPLALPPRPEQIAIVDQVKSVDDVCMELDRQVIQASGRASNLRSSVLAAAFSGKLVPQTPNDEPASALLDRIAAGRAPFGHKTAHTRQRRRKVTT
jgi:type I restriction enzyme S subunit